MIGCITPEGQEASNKAYRDRGAVQGPGTAPEPGRIQAEDYTRPYIAEGHGADSPANEGMAHYAPTWRAGVEGQGPVADRVTTWRAAMLAVPSYDREGSR